MKRIIIIGCGSIGERHLRCFQKTGRAAPVGCDPSDSIRAHVTKEYGCPAHAGLDEALAAGTWDGAVVCTPAHLHLSHAGGLLDSGIPVLIEKPLATDLGEAEQFAARFAGREREIHVAYVNRSAEDKRLLKRALHESGFGPPRHVLVYSGQHFPTWRPAYRDIYYARHETGGGAIQDALTHSVNLIEWLVNPVESLYCDAAHQVLEGVEVEDTVNLVCRLRGGALAAFSLNQFQAPNSLVIEFHCARGSICYNSETRTIRRMALGDSEWMTETVPATERDDVFVAQANAFLDTLEGCPSQLCGLEDGLQTLRVNLAALRSAREGEKIVL